MTIRSYWSAESKGRRFTTVNGSGNPQANLTSNGAVKLPTTDAATNFSSTKGGVDRNVVFAGKLDILHMAALPFA